MNWYLNKPKQLSTAKNSSTITINIDMGNNLLDCGIELVQHKCIMVRETKQQP